MTIPLRFLAIVFAASLCFLTFTACEQGPAEEAGEKIDEAVKDAGDAIKDATN